MTESWTNQLIDIIIAWTGFDFDRVRPIIAAVTAPVTANISSDDSICNSWVSTTNPQCNNSATAVPSNTRVWDVSAHTVNEETIPAAPDDRLVTHEGGV